MKIVVKVNMDEQHNFLLGKVEMNEQTNFHFTHYFVLTLIYSTIFYIVMILVFLFEIPDFFGCLEKALVKGNALQQT